MNTVATSTAVPPVSTESVSPSRVVGEQMRLLIRASFQAFNVRGPLGSGPPPHTHNWDEGYVVLDGEITVHCGSETARLRRGDAILVPAMTLHSYVVETPTAEWLTLTSPDGPADFFADVEATTNGANDPVLLVQSAERHGVSIQVPQ